MSTLTVHTSTCDFHADIQKPPPRAVFVHGFGDDLHTWDSLCEAMGAELSALRYDLRGFGQSLPSAPMPYDHAEDLLAILDALGLEQCDLVGVSMGGSIALNFTLDHPERVRRLVLLSPLIVAWEWSSSWRERWGQIAAHARGGAMDEAKRLWWEHPLFETTRMSAAGPALLDAITRFSGAQWVTDDQKSKLPDVERLHTLATPTLLLTGGRDLEDFRLMADLIEATASQVERVDDPTRGHLVHLEDPESCARRISSFLTDEPG